MGRLDYRTWSHLPAIRMPVNRTHRGRQVGFKPYLENSCFSASGAERAAGATKKRARSTSSEKQISPSAPQGQPPIGSSAASRSSVSTDTDRVEGPMSATGPTFNKKRTRSTSPEKQISPSAPQGRPPIGSSAASRSSVPTDTDRAEAP